MYQDEIFRALLPLVEALEELQIPYYIGGSVASSLQGELRSTQDADIVADIQFKHVQALVRYLAPTYYIDADMIRDAIRRKSSFNIIFLDTMVKIDIFIPKAHQFAQQEQLRAQPIFIEEEGRYFYLASPEDTILNKLVWYRMGDEISQRQWNDILGVLNRRGATLDFAYLHSWARNLDVIDLLERALTYTKLGGEEDRTDSP